MANSKKLVTRFNTPEKELSLLKSLVENASDGVHILNQQGDVVYCSKVFAELLNYTYEEAQQLNVRDWDRHFPVDQLIPVIKDLIENPKIFETKHEKKGRVIFDVEINARGIELDGELFLYASTRDITGIKREALVNKKNNAKLYSIFKTTPDAFFVIDEHGLIESVNQKAIEMFGYEEKDLIGKNISLIASPKHQNAHDSYIKNYLQTGVSKIIGQTRELEAITKDGAIIPITLNIGEAKTEEGIFFTGIIRDISIQKENQEQLEKSRNDALAAEKAKSLFLANMSHEIRTPMNGILGMVSLLKDTKLNDQQKEMLSIVSSCGDSLLTIINDILDFSKIESGKLSLENINFDLFKNIDEVSFLIANLASERGITIHTDISSDVPRFLNSDVVRIRQILTNLLNNAVKFSPEGENVYLMVSLISEDATHAKIHFSVKDNGIGMSKDEQLKLFKEFSQADQGITRKFGGTGLGLSICLKLAELLKSSIQVESEKGKGAVFSFDLELEKGRQIEEEKKILHYDGFSNQFPHNILLVEDNKINQKLATLILKKLGYDVDVAENGKEALEACLSKEYSLVFMDMQMPVMDGVSATKEIRKIRKDLLIVAMTANVLKEDRKKCFDVGMKAFITKPIKIEDIAQVIKKFSSD